MLCMCTHTARAHTETHMYLFRNRGEGNLWTALPEADSTMAFIFRESSSVSRWMDCRWNLCRVSWPVGTSRAEAGVGVECLPPLEVVSSTGGGGGGGGGFFCKGTCTGITSVSTTVGVPKLITRSWISDGVGTAGSQMSSSQVNSKIFLMPFGMAMPEFRQTMRSLETWASSLGAVAEYCRNSSRLLLTWFMLPGQAYC